MNSKSSVSMAMGAAAAMTAVAVWMMVKEPKSSKHRLNRLRHSAMNAIDSAEAFMDDISEHMR